MCLIVCKLFGYRFFVSGREREIERKSYIISDLLLVYLLFLYMLLECMNIIIF